MPDSPPGAVAANLGRVIDTALFFAFASAYLVLLGWGVALARRFGWLSAANLPVLVLLGLVYDNTVIATGRFIGEGAVLEGLSLARYWLHAFLTPLLVLFAWWAVARAWAAWARRRATVVTAIGVTVALVVLELVTVVAGLEVTPGREHGVLSYSEAEAGGVPPMVLVVAAALVAAGFVVWRRTGWVWLLVGSVLMVIGSAVPIPVDSGAVTNAFELVLLTSVVWTRHHLGGRTAGGVVT